MIIKIPFRMDVCFILESRLGRYTGNQSYVTYAEQIYTWMGTVGTKPERRC